MIGLENSVDRNKARVGEGEGSQFGLKIRGGPSPTAATELLKQAAKHKKFSPFKP